MARQRGAGCAASLLLVVVPQLLLLLAAAPSRSNFAVAARISSEHRLAKENALAQQEIGGEDAAAVAAGAGGGVGGSAGASGGAWSRRQLLTPRGGKPDKPPGGKTDKPAGGKTSGKPGKSDSWQGDTQQAVKATPGKHQAYPPSAPTPQLNEGAQQDDQGADGLKHAGSDTGAYYYYQPQPATTAALASTATAPKAPASTEPPASPTPPPTYPGTYGGGTYPPSYPPPSPPPSSAGYFELLPLTAPNVALAMANIPYTRRYWFLERAYGPGENFGTAPTTGTLDLDSGEKLKYNALYNPGCSGTVILPDGRLHTFGGDAMSPVRNLADGRNKIMAFDPSSTATVQLGTMQKNRWYPSPIVLSTGKVLIVGGSNACLLPPTWPFAELWDPAAPASPTVNVTMPETFVKFMGLNWYPFMQLLPNGDILWFVEKGGAITDGDFNNIMDLPPFPDSITHCTMFPKTSSISVLAMGPPTYDLSFVIFGGGDCSGKLTAQAASTSLRLDISKWEVEDMLGIPRVMGDSTLLPNGKVLLHGGAQFGGANAGDGWSTKANFQSLMYDPYKPVGQRYSKMDFSPIARVYHSANCLDPSGKVLVAGCENCGAYQQLAEGMSLSPDAPLEHRIEWAIPAEIAPGVTRPLITYAAPAVNRGVTITISYSYPGIDFITGAALAAPCAATHSLNMNQRVICLDVENIMPGKVAITAPPPGLFGQALLGPHLLFLIGAGGTYSEGVWITITDAPSASNGGSSW
ncbi:hypothetical protein HXX76_004170 [Chlamydomonas incerta]|uniref:Glyoxal or galactose oxidase n=1 Tax=Chlamydomonas incerta TaxID=51695 RepID=A0A835T9P7_CHLIN|nr:hypothetical protein HXX76_004170 [Chlamydomonas incerta]|eukprot:KAG2440056.1 hypothetical protein HXX76_004170 [Chlamydomonas incerta]